MRELALVEVEVAAKAREIALADGIEHAAPHGKARVDAIRALLGIGVRCLVGDEILDVAPREEQVVLIWREHQTSSPRAIHLL
jgi:hypothetical protein